MEQSQKLAREKTLDRLTQQRDALKRHMRDLEQQIKDTGQHLLSVGEHIQRLRGKIDGQNV